MTNSADPDKLASDLDLHCLQSRVNLGSAWQGLIIGFIGCTKCLIDMYFQSKIPDNDIP